MRRQIKQHKLDSLVIKKNPYLKEQLDNSHLLRRAKFLLNEAGVADSANKDGVISKIIYYISDHATLGEESSTGKTKKNNRRMSKEALALLEDALDFKTWEKKVTNEHCWPVNAIWKEIRKKQKFKGTKWILKLIASAPMVTVRVEENKTLRDKGLESTGLPEERYCKAGIEFVFAPMSPKDHFTKHLK